MSVEAYVNDHVKRLARYEVKEASELPEEAVKLDANENLLLSEGWIRGLVREAVERVDIRLYPPMYASKAVKAVAEFLGVSERNVIVDNGSDYIIDLVAKCFVGPRARALVVEPTFEMYRFYVEALGGVAESFYMTPEFALDLDHLLAKAREAKVIFLASPNNPTGTQHPREVVERLAEEFKGVLVVDEAYCPFADFDLGYLPFKYSNVIILRSFSKVAGLAGLRLGYAIVSDEVYSYLSRLQSPYSVNAVAQEAVKLVLENWGFIENVVEQVKAERDRMIKEISSIRGLRPYSSKANFVLFKVKLEGVSSRMLVKMLGEKGFRVRERSLKPLLDNCIRVTVGPPSVNTSFIKALREVVEGVQEGAKGF